MRSAIGAAMVLLAAQGGPDLPAEWRTAQEMTVGRPGPVSIALPPETLDAARADLGDLRILDPSGREIPWTLEQTPEPPPGPRKPAGIRTFLREGFTEVILETGSLDPLAGVELDVASSDFVKAGRLEESDDGRRWTTLREEEPLFATPSGARKTALDMPPGRRAWLRVTLDDRSSRPVPVTAAWILSAPPVPLPSDPLEVTVADRVEEPGRTRFVLRFPGRRGRLAEVSIDTPELIFQRRVELSVKSREGEETLSSETLFRTALEGRPPSERRWFAANVLLPTREAILTIHHGDSPPLRVERIQARARRVRVFFNAPTPGLYRLLSGNPSAKAPRYDVEALGDPRSPSTALPPGPLRSNPRWRASEPLPGVPAAGAPIDVTRWRFRKEVRLGSGGIHEIELDPDVLSAADPEGRDLRLVRGGLQIPYLRDDPPRLRSVELAAARSDNPDRRTRSRWTLSLPRPHLPVRRLSCVAKETLFRREAVLSEEVRDELGVPERAILGRAVWSRTPGQPADRLELELDRPPRGSRLDLDVEDGDNPSLGLSAFEALYAAPRLVFKTTPEGGLFLHYGNEKAPRPRYDLALLASDLITSERAPAGLGPEEPRTPSGRSSGEDGHAGGILLWVVLGVLTLVLIAVIVRLLPSRPETPPGSA